MDAMPTTKCRPLVGVIACLRPSGDLGYHVIGDKYVRAVSGGSDCLPLLIPALGDWHDPEDLAERLDGIMLTGSPSDVEPHHYDGPPAPTGLSHDPQRDATTLPLIRHALERGIPVLAVCRGIQELNVALGGSLHQRLHDFDIAIPGGSHQSGDVFLLAKPQSVRKTGLGPATIQQQVVGWQAKDQHRDEKQMVDHGLADS